jgi:hypothetical protein
MRGSFASNLKGKEDASFRAAAGPAKPREARAPILHRPRLFTLRREHKTSRADLPRSGRDLHMDGTGLSDSTKHRVIDAVLERLCTRVRYRSVRVPLREVIRRQARAFADCLQSEKNYRPLCRPMVIWSAATSPPLFSACQMAGFLRMRSSFAKIGGLTCDNSRKG